MQLSLTGPQSVDLRQVAKNEFTLVENYLKPAHAIELFETLIKSSDWRQDQIVMFGRSRPIPRKHRWFAERGGTYKWSGLTMIGEPFPEDVERLRKRLVSETGVPFNTALANLYRNGEDSVAWHADDEKELGRDPVIASVSLGATRRFSLRKRSALERAKEGGRRTFDLTSGSLLLMGPGVQSSWEHALHKTKRVHTPRINLTFRVMR